MVSREIITVNEDKCTGCGLCIPNCPEGALQIIDCKARLISDLFCDGLGACVGNCPEGAISIEIREAEPYDEGKVMSNIIKFGDNTIRAHLKHLKDHGENDFYNQAVQVLKEKGLDDPLIDEVVPCGCPGAALKEIKSQNISNTNNNSALSQWPVQLKLLPAQTPFFRNSHLLISADCVPFATANFHSKLLSGKSLAIGCPKLDNTYVEKLTEIFKMNDLKSVTVAIMEVPCCGSLYVAVNQAIINSGKQIPLIKEVISISGEIL